MDASGKVALITGGAVRVGRALTLALAELGAHVIINYRRSAAAAQETAAAARAYGVEALPIQADLGDPEAVAALVTQGQEAFGGVDILINSASPFVRGGLQETSLATWQELQRVLLEAPFLLAQALAPGMQARGAGLIVNILDTGAFDVWPDYLAHSVGKSGLWALTRNLAVALAPAVRVNAIVPGPVLPPPGMSSKRREQVAAQTLLRRWGDPADIAAALRYLVAADYVTGEALFVDGGQRWRR